MWICRICDHKTARRGNIIRHLKLLHSIDDRDCKNAYKDSVCSNGLQSGMNGSGMSLTQHITDLQGHLPRHSSGMEENIPKNRESTRTDELYHPEQIEKFNDDDMRRKKCHILDCVLDTFPEHLRTKAKSMCDILKCKNRFWILPSHEISIDGEVDEEATYEITSWIH